MKTKVFGLLLILIVTSARFAALGQGFINLNVESTSLSPNEPPGTVPTATGLPGWTALIGGTPQSTILYNNGTLGNSSVAILGNGNSVNPVIERNFSFMLTAGADPANSSSPAGGYSETQAVATVSRTNGDKDCWGISPEGNRVCTKFIFDRNRPPFSA